MHERNPYKAPIDFLSLSQAYPKLRPFLTNIGGTDSVSIDFKNVEAQRCLTEALLWRDFHLQFSLPEGRLCPPIPNRLNYILWIQDVLYESFQCLERPSEIVGIDIGIGASAIYPLLGCRVDPSWKFIGTETDPVSCASAIRNVEENNLENQIKILRLESSELILMPFQDETDRTFTFTMCNPPFYSSAKEIERNAEGKALEPNSVCTGAEVEMITSGGEEGFVQEMVMESNSDDIKDRCLWFTSMLGKLSSLEKIVEMLRTYKIDNYALTKLVQGQTHRWVVAWSFSDVRLPDNLARGLSSAHHALLPAHNSFQQTLANTASLDNAVLREIILRPLASLAGVTAVELPQKNDSATLEAEGVSMSGTGSISSDSTSLRVSAVQNSWSRAARRAKKATSSNVSDKPVAMIVDISAVRKHLKGKKNWLLMGIWRRGRDRELFESFWSHLSKKVRLAVEELATAGRSDGGGAQTGR